MQSSSLLIYSFSFPLNLARFASRRGRFPPRHFTPPSRGKADPASTTTRHGLKNKKGGDKSQLFLIPMNLLYTIEWGSSPFNVYERRLKVALVQRWSAHACDLSVACMRAGVHHRLKVTKKKGEKFMGWWVLEKHFQT